MNRIILCASAFLLLGLCLLNCTSSRPVTENDLETESEADFPDNTSKPEPTVSGAEIAAVKIPEVFNYQLTGYMRSAEGNLKMYTYRIDRQGNVSFQSFPRDPNQANGASIDLGISDEQLKTIIYHYQKVNFRGLKADYSRYDARTCSYNSDRRPYLYELRVTSDRHVNTRKLLEFCNDASGDIEDLLTLVKTTNQADYLRPHLARATNRF